MENEIIENVVETAETAVKENLPVVQEVVKKGLSAAEVGIVAGVSFTAGVVVDSYVRRRTAIKAAIEAYNEKRTELKEESKREKEKKKAEKAAKKQQAVEATNVDATPVEG